MIKINFNRQMKMLERLITDNSPMILTGLGVIGTVSTTVLAVRAGMDSGAAIEAERYSRSVKREAGDPEVVITRNEKIGLTWRFYVLPAVSALITTGCVIGAQKINARRAATLAGVLALTQDDLKTYKDKVKEKMTGPKYKEVNDEIAEAKGRAATKNLHHFDVREGDVLCVESYTGRVFSSNMNAMLKAENDLNRRMIQGMGDAASLSEFYDLIGLDHTSNSDEYGWNNETPLELDFTSMIDDRGRPAIVMNYVEPPFFRSWEAGAHRNGR